MTKYKKLLKALLAVLVGDDKRNHHMLMEQIIMWNAYEHKFVELDDRAYFVLTEKGKKFISDYIKK